MMNERSLFDLNPLSRAVMGICGVMVWPWLLMSLAAPLEAKEGDKAEAEKKKEKVVLPEAAEVALRGFVDKLTAAKQRLYTEGMLEVVKSVAQEAQLSEESAKELEKGVAAAVAAAMQGWDEKAHEWLAPFVGRSANAIREMARWPVDQIAKSPGVEGVLPPDEQPVWMAHLKQRLTPEQWDKWQAKLTRNTQELQARTEEHVAFAADNQRPMIEGEMDLIVADISNTLALPEERAVGLKKLAEDAVTATLEVWKKKALESLMKMDRERRESIIGNGNGGGRFSDEEVEPRDQSVWKEGLASLLTEAERKRVQETQERRHERRLLASQWAILQIVDERVGLTLAQREVMLPKLRPVAEKLMEQMRRYYNLDPYSVAAVLRASELKEVKAVLEPAQLADLERLLSSSNRPEMAEEPGEPAKELPAPASEEELEALLSSELTKRYRVLWEEKKAQMKTHLDDLHRQVGLREDQRLALSLASVGAVQDSLQMVRQQLGSWLRQSVAGAPIGAVRQRLMNLGTAGFGNELEARDGELWLEAIERVLDAGQKQRWQVAQMARETELRQTQLLLVMSELDQQLALTADQVAFFETHLKRILIEYADDLDDYNGARRWHLHAYSMLTPVMGVPEDALKKQLTTGQMALWEEKSASQVRHYWEGVKRKHEARAKAEEAAPKEQEVKS